MIAASAHLGGTHTTLDLGEQVKVNCVRNPDIRPYRLSSSPGPRHDRRALHRHNIRANCFPMYNIMARGHENDTFLKLKWLYSFFLQHNFDAFEDFKRRSTRIPQVFL